MYGETLTPLKIGMFTTTYFPVRSGVVGSVANFAKGLRDLGHEVYIFAPHYPEYRDTDPYVIRVPSVGIKNMDHRFSAKPLGRKAKRVMARLDMVHSQHPNLMGVVGNKVAKKYCIPLVFTAHTSYESLGLYLPMVPDDIFRWFVKSKVKSYAADCDCIVAPAQGMKDLLRGYGIKKRIEVVPNAIDTERFRSGDREGLRDLYSIGKDEVIATYVGRIAKEKRVLDLMRILRKSLGLHEFRLMVVGNGPELEKVKRLAREMDIAPRMIITGDVGNDRMHDYLAASDIFVTATMRETHPLAVLEAQSAGLPVVSMDVDGVRETVNDGKDGFLCSSEGDDFSRRVMLLVREKALRKRMSRAGIENAQKYSIQNMSRLLVKVYRSVM
jgi:glycosyltransferase involved in cell wall biosynthesis